MSVTLEQVERLRAHAAVSYEEARRALEACDGDLLDALILLEREGRIPPGGGRGAFFTTQPGAAPEPPPSGPTRGPEASGKDEKRFWGLAVTVGGHPLSVAPHLKLVDRAVAQQIQRMTALPVLILILLVLVAYWISLPLLVVGLFFGCKYRFSGPDLDKNRVGEVVNQVSAKVGDAVGQVRDEFKREFDKSRGKKGK